MMMMMMMMMMMTMMMTYHDDKDEKGTETSVFDSGFASLKVTLGGSGPWCMALRHFRAEKSSWARQTTICSIRVNTLRLDTFSL